MSFRKSIIPLTFAAALLPAAVGCDALLYDDFGDGYVQPSVGLYMGNGYIEPSLGLNVSYPLGTGFVNGFGYPLPPPPRPRPRPPLIVNPLQPPLGGGLGGGGQVRPPGPSAPPQHPIPPLRPGV